MKESVAGAVAAHAPSVCILVVAQGQHVAINTFACKHQARVRPSSLCPFQTHIFPPRICLKPSASAMPTHRSGSLQTIKIECGSTSATFDERRMCGAPPHLSR